MLGIKEIWIMICHKCVYLPSHFFNCVTPPQDFDHRNSFTPQLFHFLINDSNWLYSNDRSFSSSIGEASKTCDGFEMYFLNIDT